MLAAASVALGQLIVPVLSAALGGGVYGLIKWRFERGNVAADTAERALRIANDATTTVENLQARLTAAHAHVAALEAERDQLVRDLAAARRVKE